MKRLREKMRSQSGASILFALLMFLLCCMVAASILAAAASNAGKVRSSRVEQQKHFTLSSALELVCGQLEKAEYQGSFTIYRWTDNTDTYTYRGIDGKNVTIRKRRDFFYCEQIPGSFTCDPLTDLLPLGKELDWMFGKQFSGAGYKALYDTEPSGDPHSLTVTLPTGLDGYPYPEDPGNPKPYEVPQEVTVEVKLNHDTWHITVTAWLGGGTAPAYGSDTMRAELKAVGAPVLDYNPAGREPGSSAQGTAVEYKTTKVTWELNWIKKGADG